MEKTGVQNVAGRLVLDRSDTTSIVTDVCRFKCKSLRIEGFYFLRIKSISKVKKRDRDLRRTFNKEISKDD